MASLLAMPALYQFYFVLPRRVVLVPSLLLFCSSLLLAAPSCCHTQKSKLLLFCIPAPWFLLLFFLCKLSSLMDPLTNE